MMNRFSPVNPVIYHQKLLCQYIFVGKREKFWNKFVNYFRKLSGGYASERKLSPVNRRWCTESTPCQFKYAKYFFDLVNFLCLHQLFKSLGKNLEILQFSDFFFFLIWTILSIWILCIVLFNCLDRILILLSTYSIKLLSNSCNKLTYWMSWKLFRRW